MKPLPLLLTLCVAAVAAQEPPPTLFSERNGKIIIEAEHANGKTDYTRVEDKSASGGAFMQSGGTITFRVMIFTRGRWNFRMRTRSHDDKGNSCFVSVDGKPITSPDGIKHEPDRAIFTTIGDWAWTTKWRLSDSGCTLDLTPGIHDISFNPREPQEIDKIIFVLGDNMPRKMSGPGDPETPHLIDLAWPDDNPKLAKLVYSARQGKVGSILTTLQRNRERERIDDAELELLTKLEAFADERYNVIETARSHGDLIAAIDAFGIMSSLFPKDARLKDLRTELRTWQNDAEVKAGLAFWNLMNQVYAKPEDWATKRDEFRKQFPDCRYSKDGHWWFAP